MVSSPGDSKVTVKLPTTSLTTQKLKYFVNMPSLPKDTTTELALQHINAERQAKKQ